MSTKLYDAVPHTSAMILAHLPARPDQTWCQEVERLLKRLKATHVQIRLVSR